MEEIVALTRTLIGFRTVHAEPAEIDRCADFIAAYLENLDVAYQRLNHRGTPSMIVLPKNGRVPVLLMAHFDVVEASEPLFQPVERSGCLYGRGSLDDKYAVALSLVLIKEFLHRYRQAGMGQADLPFGILLTGDEEAGGENGARPALARIDADFCIVLDGGGVDEIITKEKGILQLQLTAQGKSAHGARPWMGRNAAEILLHDYLILKDFFPATDPHHWHRTMNLSRIEAGKSLNQVPDIAEAVVDIRYTEHDEIPSLLSKMKSAIQSRVTVLMKEPLFIAQPSPYLDLLLSLDPAIRQTAEHGSSDARFLSLYGINGIVWGADGSLSHHSENEHLDLGSLFELYQRLKRFLERIATLRRS
jgi:succinyl-diaminopimelate desuccinylase